MTEELLKYLIDHCREWMLPVEIRALLRISLTDDGEKVTREMAAKEFKFEEMYGFSDNETNQLVSLGIDKLKMTIAESLIYRHGKEILNYCPACNGLTRTPKAKQCRYCGHAWH